MLTFIQRENSVVVLIGHPTRQLIDQTLTLPGLPKVLAVVQQEMHEAPKSYDLWSAESGTRSFNIGVPLEEALRGMGASKSP